MKWLLALALLLPSTPQPEPIGPWAFEGTPLTVEQRAGVVAMYETADFPWGVFETRIRVTVVDAGPTYAGSGIVINGADWGADLYLALAHETGHVYDNLFLTTAERLQMAPEGNWAGIGLDYNARPIEKWARSFARLLGAPINAFWEFPVSVVQAHIDGRRPGYDTSWSLYCCSP